MLLPERGALQVLLHSELSGCHSPPPLKKRNELKRQDCGVLMLSRPVEAPDADLFPEPPKKSVAVPGKRVEKGSYDIVIVTLRELRRLDTQ